MAASFTVSWTRFAEADLAAIVELIADRSPAAASETLDLIEHRAATLTRFPARGRVLPELAEQGIRIYREIVVHPWRIIYRIDGNHVDVLAVVDGRRNLEDVLLNRLAMTW